MIQTLDVSMIPQSYLPEIRVSKNDNTMRTIKVNMIDEQGNPWTPPTGATAVFVGTKPSGLGFTLPCTISESSVSFTMLTTACNEDGRFPAEVRVTDGSGGRIGSCNVMMNVEWDPHSDDTTDGDKEELINEITALLEEIREEHQQAIEDITDAKTDALQDIGAAKDDALDAIAADVQAADAAAQRAQESADQAAESEAKAEQAKQEWENMSATAETLPAGFDATADYNEGVLSLGIPTGPQGAQGPKGDPGQTGATPDLQIGTVETLDPGEDATATITGTPEQPILSLGIPQGEKGDPGDVSMEQLLALAVYDEASGEIASFPDGSDGLPMKSLKVNLEPIQENTPWIGTEKNTEPYLFRAMPEQSNDYNREFLNSIVGATVAWNQMLEIPSSSISKTENGVTITDNRDGTYSVSTASGGATDNTFSTLPSRQVIAGHKYFWSGTPSGGGATTYDSYLTNNVDAHADYGSGVIYNATGTGTTYVVILRVRSGAVITNPVKFVPQLIDLTSAFDVPIADYAYQLEQSTAGSGVSWLKAHFPKMFAQYNGYNAGELESASGLVSHDMVGKNLFDASATMNVRDFSRNGETFTNINTDTRSTVIFNIVYLSNGSVVGIGNSKTITATGRYSITLNVPSGIDALRIRNSGSSRDLFFEYPFNGSGYHTISADFTSVNPTVVGGLVIKNIQIELGSTATDYTEYEKHSYPLDSDLTLRGLLKLDADNNLYADGDVYSPSGGVSRPFAEADLGDLNWNYNGGSSGQNHRFHASIANGITELSIDLVVPGYVADDDPLYGRTKDKTACLYSGNVYIEDNSYSDATAFKTAMSGRKIVYAVQTPTTEQADPYTQLQVADPNGTEEFVTDSIVPVGQESTYSLVCPVYGTDEVTVKMAQKNLFSGEYNVMYKLPQHLSANTFATASCASAPNTQIRYYDIDGNQIDYWTLSSQDGNRYYRSFKLNSDTYYVKFTNSNFTPTDMQFEIAEPQSASALPTPYEQPRTITTALPQTVYGGTLDVVTGELVATWGSVTFDGSENWSIYASGETYQCFTKGLTKKVGWKTSKTDSFVNVDYAFSNNRYGIYCDHPTNNQIYFRQPNADVVTIANWKQWLNSNPIQVVYELATPQTYQLTPTEVDTLLGQNNVWSDVGNVYVKYIADTKLYILKVISQ